MRLFAVLTMCAGLSVSLAACMTGGPPPSTFVVFFSPNSSTLPPEAGAALDGAAAAVKRTHPAQVAIAAGAARGNALALAEPRYEAVRKALTDRGVEQKLIARSSLPVEGGNLDATGYQRVEIILGPK